MLKLSKLLLRTSTARFNSSMQTNFQVKGKVAVVTASSEGIGFAIARGLAENGAKVMISSRSQENVDKAVKILKDDNLDVSGVVCHVGKTEHRELLFNTVIEKYGKLDILVSNAAVSPYFGPTIQTPEKAWDKIFDINVKSSFLLAQHATPYLKETKGSMLFVSSIGGYVPFNFIGAYSISKTSLIALVKTLASELGQYGIRVNAIAPGVIKTDFSSTMTETESVSKQVLRNCPLGRFGEPHECAGAAVFLSSHAASYITGEVIAMTGGMHSRL